MKTTGERQWMKMSTHGKKDFLNHHGLDKKLAVSTWAKLPEDIRKKFESNPVVRTVQE